MRPLIGHLAAAFTITIWGVTFVSTKVLLVDFSPLEIVFYRLLFAVLALSIASPPSLARPTRAALAHEWKVIAAGLCGVTLYFLFQNVALTYTLAANVSVLVSAAPLFTALVSRFLLGEKLKANFFLGFGAAMTGIILIAYNGSLALRLNPLGDLLSLLAGLSWAFYSVLVRQASAAQASTLALTRRVVFYGLLFVLPVLPFFEFRLEPERLASLPNLLNLLYLGVGSSALSFVTWNFALRLLGPIRTSAYIYLVPVITIVFSVIFLQEPVSLASLAGMALIMAGIGLSEWERR